MVSIDYAVELAKMVITRFEKSFKIKGDAPSGNMSIKLIDNKKYMSDKDYEYRLKINEIAIRLEQAGLLKIKWYEKNNIIDRFYFNLENLDRFYEISKVERKIDSLNVILLEVENFSNRIQTKWIQNFFDEVKIEIENNRRLPYSLKDEGKRHFVFESLAGIDELLISEGLILERVFSKKYLKNSKVFEKEIRGIVLGIIKKYCLDIDNTLSPEEILIGVGIEKTTTELFIKGALRLKCLDRILDLTDFPYGTALNTQTLRLVSVLDSPINRFISIENKANYLDACEKATENELIVFSSGFYNPSQRRFLAEVRDILIKDNQKCVFFHSGDLDYGGFNIFNHIKKNMIPEIQPLNMNVQIFQKYIEFAEELKSADYRSKLEKLLSNGEYEVFHDLISYLLEKNKTLEQEAFLF